MSAITFSTDSSEEYILSVRGTEIQVYMRWGQGHVQHAEAGERIMYRCTISFMYQSALEMNSVFDY